MYEHIAELKEQFIEWLIDPANSKTPHMRWAEEHGVTERQLRRWKEDKKFREMVAERAAQYNVEPIRIQSVINALYKKATEGDVKAAEQYLRYVDRLMPQRLAPIGYQDDPQKMSDEELMAELQAMADELGGRKAE